MDNDRTEMNVDNDATAVTTEPKKSEKNTIAPSRKEGSFSFFNSSVGKNDRNLKYAFNVVD